MLFNHRLISITIIMLPKSYSPDCGNTNWKPPSPLYDSTLPAERSLSYRSPIQSSRETGKIFYKR